MSDAGDPAPTLTIAALRRRALARLARAEASRAMLRAALLRWAGPRAGDLAPAELARRVDAVLDELAASGIQDDARFARGRAAGLVGRGRSGLQVRAALGRAAVDRETVEQAVGHVRAEVGDPDLHAAVEHARRKRLGPWRPAEARVAESARDIARLCRAGFPHATARTVVLATSVEELRELLAGAA